MGQFTARQRQILLLLLDRREGMTAAEIAADTGVSVRTIHRELDGIEKTLQDSEYILHKKSGTGIRLESRSTADLNRLRKRLVSDRPLDYSQDERKVMMLCELLDSPEPIKLYALAHILKVTVATVSSDLDELAEWVESFGLQLIRRRGYGVELSGSESEKRRVICRLALEYLDYSDLIGITQLNANTVTSRLLALVGKPMLLDVEKTLWDMNWQWTESVNERAYMVMLIALSAAVARISKGRIVEEQYSPEPVVLQPTEQLAFAAQFAERLHETLSVTFPEREIVHIAQLFADAREMSEADEMSYSDVEMVEIVVQLIESAEMRTGIPFSKDRILREGLVEHIGAAMKRIREGTRIRNPLLHSIRKDYEDLFALIREAVNDISRFQVVPDEEIGFLVMHFGASIERMNQPVRNIRAILVCSSGLSSSRLLGTRLGKEIPQIEVLGNVSWYEAARIPPENYDLIISTIELPLASDKYVKLSPLLTREDKEKLLAYINSDIFNSHDAGVTGTEGRKNPRIASVERLRSQAVRINELLSLLEAFKVHAMDNAGESLQETLHKAVSMVEADGAVTDAAEVTECLMERERMGSQVIPNTALALFHTRSHCVAWPTLTLIQLTEAVELEDAKVKVILLMLAPKQLEKESLEVLSEISALMLKSELIERMELGDEMDIKAYLAEEMQHFLSSKL